MAVNLTSLSNVKTWLNVPTTTDNTLLTTLIGQVSRAILSYLQRATIFQATFNDTYDGTGSRRQILKYWPVLSVSSLTIGNQSISASSGYGQTGWTLEAADGYPPGRTQALNLTGHSFWQGLGNVAVTYIAGYVIQNEAQTVPSGNYQVTPNVPYGSWAADQGVSYANGTAMTAVSSNPGTGQYVPPNPSGSSPTLYYQFAAGDSNASILLNYSYIPADIEEACIDTVAERYRYKEHIGEKSHSLGGQETVSFDNSGLTPFAKQLLQPYRRVLHI